MKIIDISWPIAPGMTAYKNETTVQFSPLKNFETDKVRKTQITLDSHTGTHIDAPTHFLKSGDTTSHIELESLIGPCAVIDLSNLTGAITADHLEEYDLEECEIVLIKTRNSNTAPDAPFEPNFVYLDASAAQYLAELELSAVGFDYIGIERNQPTHATHIALFDAEVTIIEGLRLKAVEEGEYFFVCLPLAVQNIDGAPARAILVEGL